MQPSATPPLPNRDLKAADALKLYEAGDFEGVLGSPESVRSPAGISLRSLAALKLLRNETDPSRLGKLAAVMAGSIDFMTPKFLEEAEQRFIKLKLSLPPLLNDWRTQWERELTTAFLHKQIDPKLPATWHTHDGVDYLLELGEGENWRFNSEAEVRAKAEKTVQDFATSLPEGLEIDIFAGGRNVTGTERASIGLIEVDGWTARIILADRSAFERAGKQGRSVISALLFLAGFSALIGIIQSGRAYLRAHELARLQSEFTAAVSHEMRTPLAAIGLLAENLESGAANRAGMQGDHIRLIREESKRLGTMIDNVLIFTRDQIGETFATVDVPAMVAATDALMRPFAASKGIAFEVEVSPFGVSPRGNSEALGRALINLIDNAIKHTPTGGSVLCKVSRKDPNHWMIEVTDSGSGIPENERKKIFEAFYRVGDELRRTTAGTGLGLALVKRTLDFHRGTIQVDNAPGGGARFTLTLPLQP